MGPKTHVINGMTFRQWHINDTLPQKKCMNNNPLKPGQSLTNFNIVFILRSFWHVFFFFIMGYIHRSLTRNSYLRMIHNILYNVNLCDWANNSHLRCWCPPTQRWAAPSPRANAPPTSPARPWGTPPPSGCRQPAPRVSPARPRSYRPTGEDRSEKKMMIFKHDDVMSKQKGR